MGEIKNWVSSGRVGSHTIWTTSVSSFVLHVYVLASSVKNAESMYWLHWISIIHINIVINIVIESMLFTHHGVGCLVCMIGLKRWILALFQFGYFWKLLGTFWNKKYTFLSPWQGPYHTPPYDRGKMVIEIRGEGMARLVGCWNSFYK